MILWALNCRGAGCPLKERKLCEDPNCGAMPGTKMPSSISAHESNLRKMSCVVTGSQNNLSLHHTRGGSMGTSPFGAPGAGQKQNPALQIRLAMAYHVGQNGIDARIGSSIKDWEKRNGTQVEYLNSTSLHLKYSVWMLGLQWASPLVRARIELFCDQSPSLFLRLSTATSVTGSSSPES